MARWIRERTHAQVAALALGAVLLARVAVNATDWFPLGQQRSWVWVEAPFDLVQPVQSFWFELALVAAAMVAVAWIRHDWRVRSALPLAVSLAVLGLLAMFGGDVVMVLGTRAVRVAEHLAIPPTSWSLLAVDAPAFLFWSVGVTSLALLVLAAVGRVIGRRGEQALQPDASSARH